MNRQTAAGSGFLAYSAALLGAFLIVFFLVQTMKRYTSPPPVNQARAQERSQALADLRAASTKALGSYAWQDQSKEIVRLPIERAMELVVRQWQDPASARANLIARMELATAVPEAPPEEPSIYE